MQSPKFFPVELASFLGHVVQDGINKAKQIHLSDITHKASELTAKAAEVASVRPARTPPPGEC
jgi:hypothetical protein